MTFLLVVLLIATVIFVSKYNKLQGFAHQVRRFNGDVMASLQKKTNLANRLMDIAKEYGAHEKLSHITVSNNYRDSIRETNEALVRINALSQQFPQLRANESYNLLMSELSSIETNIQRTREMYNLAASSYNSYRSQIPQSFFASSLGFGEAPYFDTNNIEALREFRTDDGEMLKRAFTHAVDKTVETVKKGAEDLGQAIHKKSNGTQNDDGSGE